MVGAGTGARRGLLLAAVFATLLLLPATAAHAQTVPDAPTIDSITGSATALTIAWSAPQNNGGLTITAYDLRYIWSGEMNTTDDRWTLVEGIWSSGTLEYELTGLDRDSAYELQVRAVNSLGAGAWSDSETEATTDHGDTQEAATTITLGSATRGRISPQGDADYFQITLDEDTRFWAYTTGLMDTVGELLTSDGDVIQTQDDAFMAAGTRNFALQRILDAGTYYVKITGYKSGARGDYTLHTRAEDRPNLTWDDAIPVSSGTLFMARFDGQFHRHFYEFTIEEKSLLWARTALFEDVEVELYNSDRRRIAHERWSGLEGNFYSTSLVRVIDPGTYHFRLQLGLHQDNDWPHLPYIFEVFLTGGPGNTPSTAQEVSLETVTDGWLSSQTDKDYYRLDVQVYTLVEYYFLSNVELSIESRLLDELLNDISSEATRGRVTQHGRRAFLLQPGTYYIEVSSTSSSEQAYSLHVLFPDAENVFAHCGNHEHEQSDPLYGCQWHLKNDGQFGGAEKDINVEPAWQVTKGAGVNVAVVDDGLQFDHPDLKANVLAARNHSYVDGTVYNPDEDHGTAVAGLIAARDDDIGVRGVAPRASIYGYNLLVDFTTDNLKDAMMRHLDDTVVSNNSWGPRDNGRPHSPESTWEEAVESGVREGNGGKGISYVWAGGNGGVNDNSSMDGYANYYAVTAVCAVNHDDTAASYSEPGANLWVCAPSNPGARATPGITTTDTRSWYRTNFGGTSAAAPIVSGVIALVRAAYPDLTWRDVKLILAASARQNDPTHDSWEEGALHYGPHPDPDRYNFSHRYGFGVVDAGAALTLAESWDPLPELREVSASSSGDAVPIPDAPSSGDPTTLSSTLTLDQFVDFTEFIEVIVDLQHDMFVDLEIELESPSGTVSTLVASGRSLSPLSFIEFLLGVNRGVSGAFRLGSARHLGENPTGEWTLRITDTLHADSGTLRGWSLTAYGHGASAGAPAIESAAAGDTSITVTWTAPVVFGESPVTGYDLRHRREDVADRTESGWTTLTDIWTSGNLTYELAGLVMGYRYDLQVRATTDDGPGPWSKTVEGATNPVIPGAPAISRLRKRNGGLDILWDEPAFTGGAAITSYDLRIIRTDAMEREDEDWTVISGAGTADGERYTHRVTELENEVSYDVQVRAHNSEGASDWSAIATETPEENLPPSFVAGQSSTRSVPENTAPGTGFGEPFQATDPNDQELRYSSRAGGLRFGIDAATGQLLLRGELDYETTTSYSLIVSVSDLQDEHGDDDSAVDDSLTVTVMVEDVDEPPTVNGSSAANLLEGETGLLATYTADDPEDDPVTWSLRGDDAAPLVLNDRAQLRFRQPPDYETPLDADEDNYYEVAVVANDGENEGLIPVTVWVRNLNEEPVIEGPVHVAVEEAGSVDVGVYYAADPEGVRLFWRAPSGPDGGRFAFDQGRLTFREAPDFEARADANGDNVYEVTINVSDYDGTPNHPGIRPGKLDVEVTVRNVNEAPVISGPAGPFTVRENGPLAVASFSAADPDENDDVSLELGGLDRAAFTLDGGRLAFASAPDYEAPADSDSDNAYELTLSTSDGEETASLDLVVRVTNEDEAGALTLSSPQPRIGVLLEATLSEPDDVSAESWTWERSSNRSSWSVISGAGGSAYTPAVADRDHYLRVTVRYRDAFGQKSLRSASTNPTRPDPGNNTAPFFATPPPDLTVAEQTPPGRAVGSPVEGADNENDPLTYTLSVSPGGRPSFVIGRFTGQVRVAPDAVLDHEDSDAYGATVTIADSFNVRASASFTITVTDVDEPPLAEDDSGATFEDTAALVDVLFNDRDPEGEPLSISFDRPPQLGTATVTAGNLISYLPDPDTHGIQRFSYRVSDGIQSATAEVTVRVEPVNDNPEFPAATAAREVDELAAPGDPVGDPVVATDVDGDTLAYSLIGSALFTVEPHNGQIMLAEDAFLDARAEPVHAVTLLVDDAQGGSAGIEVTITVLEAVVEAPSRTLPVFVPGGGGGGGGGGPSGPTPSTVDFEWTVKHDLEALDAANESPTGMWSDGVTLWVANNPDGPGDAVYAYDLKSGERVEEREFDLDAANRAPRGLWSDGETVWVTDSGRDRLFAYALGSGERLEERDLELAAANDDARGLWSDGERLWVLDDRDDALYAYDLATGELLGGFALDARNASPRGLWSDGVSLWVSDPGASPRRLFAYRLPVIGEGGVPADAVLERVDEEDFAELSGASNNSPRGIWSDGDVMYVADASDGKVYTYNMPDAIDARLASLTLSGVDIGDFDPARTDYEGVIAGGVTETTVTAEAVQRRTDVAVAPPDADAASDGHQVSLEGLEAITVTVTSADGTRTKVYRVGFERDEPLLLAPGWNSLRWTGPDGAPIAEALAAAGDVLAVYAWDAASGAWLAHLPGLGHLPGANTLSAFSSGQTYWIALDDAPASEVAAAAASRP